MILLSSVASFSVSSPLVSVVVVVVPLEASSRDRAKEAIPSQKLVKTILGQEKVALKVLTFESYKRRLDRSVIHMKARENEITSRTSELVRVF